MSVAFDDRVPVTLESCNSVITIHSAPQDTGWLYFSLGNFPTAERRGLCIPYLAIDRGEQREPEVSEPPSALRACLVTKMAENFARFGDETSQRYLGSSYYRLESTATHFRKERRGRLKSCNSSRMQYMRISCDPSLIITATRSFVDSTC